MLHKTLVVSLLVLASVLQLSVPVLSQPQPVQTTEFAPFAGDWQGTSNFNHAVRFVVPAGGANPEYYYRNNKGNFEWIKVQNGSVVFRLISANSASGQATITPDGSRKMNITFTPDREAWVMKAVLTKK